MMSPFKKGERILGRYVILKHIGRGGMAEVYKASDPVEGELVALKVLSKYLAQDPKIERRFQREIRVLMEMDHAHIVALKEVGEHNGFTVLVMPYLDVGSLSERLRKGSVGLEEGARIIDQVASALQYSHEKGVIHRDVKPSNILLNKEEDAFLTDFGIARVHETLVSLTGSALLGTPAYMAPEQARGDQVTEKSDQYSLGVVLYQMATGQLPFAGETPMAVMYKQIYEPLPSPRMVRGSIPAIIERFILKATAKRPDDRFESIAEMRSVFRQAMRHLVFPDRVPEPEIELPRDHQTTRFIPGAPEKKLPIWRRYPVPSAIVSVLIIASLITLTVLASSLNNRTSGRRAAGTLTEVDSIVYEQTISAMAARIQRGGTPYANDDSQTQDAAAMGANLDTATSPVGQATETTPTEGAPAAGTGSPTPVATQSAATTPPPSQTVAVIVPSATRTRTPTNTPTRTPTPTTTKTPTATFTATSTYTITPSPTPDVCLTASISSPAVDGEVVRVVVRNDGSAPVSITALSVSWPRENEALVGVELDGNQVWSGSQTSSPLNLNLSDGYQLGEGASAQSVFSFSENARDSGYTISVQLNAVCSISTDQ